MFNNHWSIYAFYISALISSIWAVILAYLLLDFGIAKFWFFTPIFASISYILFAFTFAFKPIKIPNGLSESHIERLIKESIDAKRTCIESTPQFIGWPALAGLLMYFPAFTQ